MSFLSFPHQITNQYNIFSIRYNAQKTPSFFNEGVSKKGNDLLSHTAVPSALTGLTSLFGMVRGEPRRYNHLKF